MRRCFWNILNPAKKLSLMSQREDFGIIEMVDQLGNMLQDTGKGSQHSIIKISELIITNAKKRASSKIQKSYTDLILEALNKQFIGLSEKHSSNGDLRKHTNSW